MASSLKKRLPFIAITAAGVAVAAGLLAPIVHPPVMGSNNPTLNTLRQTNTDLGLFDDQRLATLNQKLAIYRRQTWTEDAYQVWKKANVPQNWAVNDLGPTDLKHLHSHRYAFQRPGATAKEWPEIENLLQSLESQPNVSVPAVNLAVHDGVNGSRQFSQCLIIATFYFQGDDVPTSTQPKS